LKNASVAVGSQHAIAGPVESVLVSTIERNAGCEVRVYLVRLPRRDARVSAALWYRNAFKLGDDWRPEQKARGGFDTLIRASEVPLVVDAFQRAIEKARQLGWHLR